MPSVNNAGLFFCRPPPLTQLTGARGAYRRVALPQSPECYDLVLRLVYCPGTRDLDIHRSMMYGRARYSAPVCA
jgi:hypothetical protein